MLNYIEVKIGDTRKQDPLRKVQVNVSVKYMTDAWLRFWEPQNRGNPIFDKRMCFLTGRTESDQKLFSRAHDLRLDALVRASTVKDVIISVPEFTKRIETELHDVIQKSYGHKKKKNNSSYYFVLDKLREYLLNGVEHQAAYDAEVLLRLSMPFTLEGSH